MQVSVIPVEQTFALRHKVLWPHIEKTDDCVIDIDRRADAIHLGCKNEDGEVIGICSLFEMRSPRLSDARQYRLRAMATDPDKRGKGAGRLLVQEALRMIEAEGYDVLWCDARKVALGFYSRMGFECIDEWYEVRNIGPHKCMYFRFSPESEQPR